LAPDAPVETNDGLVFRRLEELRAVMLGNGDGARPIWITEMGWTVEAPADQPDIAVSLEEQASYLNDALDQTRREWPWVELVTVWNLSQPEPGNPFGGYSLIGLDGDPRPAYEALSRVAENRDSGIRTGRKRLGGRRQPEVVQVLAEDAIVHLGDSDLPSPWWPLFAGRKPSIAWTGGFYIQDPGRSDWTLALELMQQNEYGASVSVNGLTLSPDLPLEDFARRWLTVRRRVPVSALRPGYNEVTVRTVRLAPDLQHDEFAWDDFQIRNVRLEAASP
jgi:hypothetical protein